MTGLQIAMIVIGMVCLIGSFFVSEKLSKADLEEMKKMSEQEIKVILDARMQDASAQIDENGIIYCICQGTDMGKNADYYKNQKTLESDPRGMGAVLTFGSEMYYFFNK